MDAGTAEPCLVLVTGTEDPRACATVMVLSPDIEMGTDADLLLSREISGLSYDLVALPDVTGPAWFVQLGPVLGVVGVSNADLPPAGIALRDERDSRWAWKESRLDALVSLTAECRYQLLDGEAATVADPAAFDLDLVRIEDRTYMTLDTVRLLRSESIRLSAAALRLTVVGHDSPAYESYAALLQTIPRHPSLLISDISGEQVHPGRELANDPLPGAVAALIDGLDNSVRCIRVTSVSSLWGERSPSSRTEFFELFMKGRRHQMVVTNVDRPEVSCV